MGKLIISNKDVTREIVAYLKSKDIYFQGTPPEIFIDCFFSKLKHQCTIFTDNGLVICKTCKRAWSFETLQLEMFGRVSLPLQERKNPEKRMGVLNLIPKFYTQTELEKFVIDTNNNLTKNPEILQWFVSNTGISKETIIAFRIGWLDESIALDAFNNFSGNFVLPVVNLQGAYMGMRFFPEALLVKKQKKIIPGWGGNMTFWGNKHKRVYAFLVVDNPIECIKIAQQLAYKGPDDICVVSPAAGSRGIPQEWMHSEFFGRKLILLSSIDCKFTDRFFILMQKFNMKIKNPSQFTNKNSILADLSNLSLDLRHAFIFSKG